MGTAATSMRNLAQRLLAAEAADQSATDAHAHEAVRVCEKLRTSLIRLAGVDGFASLLRRSLALAREEAPRLHRITVNPDCTMEGFDEIVAEAKDGNVEASMVLTSHLLGLLVTFIGEPLTLRIVRDAWPDAGWDE